MLTRRAWRGQAGWKWVDSIRHLEAHTTSWDVWHVLPYLTTTTNLGSTFSFSYARKGIYLVWKALKNMDAKQSHYPFSKSFQISWIQNVSDLEKVTWCCEPRWYWHPILSRQKLHYHLPGIFLQQNIGILSLRGISADYNWPHVTPGHVLPPNETTNLGEKNLSDFRAFLGLESWVKNYGPLFYVTLYHSSFIPPLLHL